MITKNFDLKIDKQLDDSDYFTFTGTATTQDVDREGDIVLSTAYEQSLNKQHVILFNHDMGQPIGVTTELKSTKDGLIISAKLPKDDTFVKNRIIPQMKAGSLKSLSIGFMPNNDKIDYNDGIRVFKEIELLEISIVAIPANKNADITQMKKLELEDVESIHNKRDFEKVLRESKLFSKRACVYLSSLCKFESDSQEESKEEFNQKMLQVLNKMETK